MTYNSESNRARNFKSASCFAYSSDFEITCYYSLNCTPLGPITIPKCENLAASEKNLVALATPGGCNIELYKERSWRHHLA